MIVLLQRVKQAHVEIGSVTVGQIAQGLLVFCGFQPQDDEQTVSELLERVLNYRVFADDADKMNRSVRDIQGGLLLVPQFTLAADTTRGRRPGFSTAAPPDRGEKLFDYLLHLAATRHDMVESGRFGADMQVHLQNDGPVTFLLKHGEVQE